MAKLKVHVLLKGLQLKLILRQGRKTIRSERLRSVMKLMYANTMKMSRTQGRGK